MFQLIRGHGNILQKAVANAVSKLPLDQKHKSNIIQAFLNVNTAPRFKAFIKDLTDVCNGMMTIDAIIGYLM
jgi:hypothetical protein